ncbi:MAG: glycosyltransferase [Chloroflexota bacterium]
MSSAPTLANVSVIIPTYHRPERLARALAAISRLPGAHEVQVVVCDDGSPPEDGAAYRRVVEECGLDVLLVHQENGGPGAARNRAGQAARRPLLLFTDDDCLPTAGFFQHHVRDRLTDERVAVLGHVSWAPDVEVTPFMEMVMRGAQFNFVGISDPEHVPFTCFYFANCSVWKEDLERAGWFNPSLRFAEDAELAYRLVKSGTRLVYRPEALVHHEHDVELDGYIDTAHNAGRTSVEIATLHPELFDALGLWQVADAGLREQYYSIVLRYAFICGVEDGLEQRVARGEMTGAELRGKFEEWVAGWALRRTGETRAWRRRAEVLDAEVRRRDSRLAEVIQEKDDRIAVLEAQLSRFNSLPPVRVYQRLAALTRRSKNYDARSVERQQHE